ncbi:MAG: aminotransferase class I/II-fold pyridoxal phosphate-dependent enzyme [Cytophagaceae bacterium]|nr:aminotransferase class I/II-fold pyridoxal phosphate-dependent enzyme [Cytophagaceae bacterium]MDW8455273.1 aminotransferase class I/II-fold pyridoxal phosphate-dependent enzyme [Cytophagaceae bacterium]
MIIPKAERLHSIEEYYFVKKLEEIARLNKEGKNVINFGIGSPDLPPSTATVSALIEHAARPDIHGYQPYRGLPELREKIADWYLRTYKVHLDPHSEVLPLAGSKEGILHISMAFLNPGDAALIPNPGYPTYTSLTSLIGARPLYYNLTDKNYWYPDFDELNNMDLSGVKIMWVNYPHMPTGTPARYYVFEKLVRFASEHNILLCHDNPYSLVLPQQEPASILKIDGAKDVAIELNSLSKSHNMAGWRVGMMLGKKDYLQHALAVKSNIDSGMFYAVQKAAINALDNTQDWHYQRNQTYTQRREVVFKIFDLLDIEYAKDQVGMFVWGKPRRHMPSSDVAGWIDEILYSVYVFFTPGKIFGTNGNDYLRASLCVPLDKMEEAYDRLKHFKG